MEFIPSLPGLSTLLPPSEAQTLMFWILDSPISHFTYTVICYSSPLKKLN